MSGSAPSGGPAELAQGVVALGAGVLLAPALAFVDGCGASPGGAILGALVFWGALAFVAARS